MDLTSASPVVLAVLLNVSVGLPFADEAFQLLQDSAPGRAAAAASAGCVQ